MPPIPGTLRGEPVQIVTISGDHLFQLNEEALANILCDDAVRDKKICVLSVAGAFRTGKSFILNFFLRYLARNGATNWLGMDDEPLTGFAWRCGSERVTSGIWAWNKLFICKIVGGEEIAVMLLDTQGAFDTDSRVRDWASVFALSTMVSSVQIFNLSQNIQENDLHHLQLFTDYGRLAQNYLRNSETPFQCLLFLVRDWSYPFEYAYGVAGGQTLLDSILNNTGSRHEELEEVRRHIRSCFENIRCFLMPHPGLAVTGEQFDGRLADINSEFRRCLNDLAPRLLAPPNLIVKSINGSRVSCRVLLQCFKTYVNIFQNGELPEPTTLLRATSEANNLTAVALALDQYNASMDEVCGGGQPHIESTQLENNHQMFREDALRRFGELSTMGGEELIETYGQDLITRIEVRRDHYVKNNERKNLLNRARQWIVKFFVKVILYLLLAIFAIYLLGKLKWCTLVVMIIVMCCVCETGWFLRLRGIIDSIADFIWLKFFY